MSEIKQTILEATRYKREAGELKFSASMMGNTTLQNYLAVIHGAVDSTEIGQSTIGSITHLGMEKMLIDKGFESQVEATIYYEREDGWKVSATVDYYDETGDIPVIRDWKLTKLYAGKSVKKDLNHGYRLQVNVARHILKKSNRGIINMALNMFYKDANPLNNELAYEEIKIAPIEDIEQQIDKKIEELKSYIDSGETPPECSVEDQWIRRTKSGGVVKSRCTLYCSHNFACPYYNSPSTKTAVSNW